jgi:glycosyltransferase involved in cell wall biosynthesis
MSVRISIVIPTFDRPAKLARALGSCLRQSAPAFEIIVVDNGQNPATRPTVESAQKTEGAPPIHYIPSDLFDIRKALAKGIEAAQGDWLILLDDDDFLVAERIENDTALISDVADDVYVIVQDFLRIDYANELVWEHRMAEKSLGLYEALVLDSFPPPPAATWRTASIQALHSFHTPEGWMTDFDLYASLLPHGQLIKSHRHGYVMDDTRVAGRLTGNIDKALKMIELHRERYRAARAKVTETDSQIDRRLDQQIAFFAGKAIGLKALGGPTSRYARQYFKEVMKGFLAPLRAAFSRLFADQMPEMRGSKSYSLKQFSQRHQGLSQLIKTSKLTEE